MDRENHEKRLQSSYADWLKHRAILENYRVHMGDRRTTPPPAFSVSELFPELAQGAKTAVRLHPRYGDEAEVDASKMGGTFLWPAGEQWPVCSVHKVPYVSVLQLRADDFPEMPFPAEKDIFQVLWCPRDHFDVPECEAMPCPMYWANPKFYWRNRRQVDQPRTDNPTPQQADYEYVPFPCRLLPERVIELPTVYELPDELVDRIYEWESEHRYPDGTRVCYEFELSSACGTKIGGYIRWIQFPWLPACECGAPMEHLLTIASMEWNGDPDPRWTPMEERAIFATFPKAREQRNEEQKATWSALWNPTGLMLGDGGQMQLFICRHCGRWPIVPNIECC